MIMLVVVPMMFAMSWFFIPLTTSAVICSSFGVRVLDMINLAHRIPIRNVERRCFEAIKLKNLGLISWRTLRTFNNSEAAAAWKHEMLFTPPAVTHIWFLCASQYLNHHDHSTEWNGKHSLLRSYRHYRRLCSCNLDHHLWNSSCRHHDDTFKQADFPKPRGHSDQCGYVFIHGQGQGLWWGHLDEVVHGHNSANGQPCC